MEEQQGQGKVGSASELIILALGFGCFMALMRFFSQGAGFETGAYESISNGIQGWHGDSIRSLVRLALLVVLAFAGWRKVNLVSIPTMVATVVLLAAGTIALGLGANVVGDAVSLAAEACVGLATGMLMYVWVMLLSSRPPRLIVFAALAGLLASGALIALLPGLTQVLSLALLVCISIVSAAVPLAIERNLSFAQADGPLTREQVNKIPWFAVVVLAMSGMCGTMLYGVSAEVVLRYGFEPSYLAFGLSAVAVVGITSAIMLSEGDWTQAVWVPLFVLFLIAVVFSCLATNEAVVVSAGLLLGCVFCFHFLRFSVYPVMLNTLEIPRAFLSAMLLIITNSFFTSQLGVVVGSAAAQGLRGLAQVAGLMAVLMMALFALMVGLFMRRPRQAAVVTSTLAEAPEIGEALSAEELAAQRLGMLAEQYGLTEREVEVAGLSAQGYNAPYIAEKLVVSQSTVRFHLQNVYRKLGIHARTELIEIVNQPNEEDQ